ncbi:MAG TPA: TetR/AcrR family transcriptional regulator [Nocardioidaceae bacterium]|nr:TetR/AcrR family transcriptional regulator [Nocardioidaceae bacterium]
MSGERSSSRVDRRRAATRKEILDAAWELSRERGLASLSLRELAARVGMQAPSLYSYFPSKDAIYDAMFADGQRQLAAWADQLSIELLSAADLAASARSFVDFCVSDSTRYQLLFQRVVPGYEPTPESYVLAVANLERLRAEIARLGVTRDEDVDLWTALITGLTDQQISNDPGGDRWARLVGDAVAMFCAHIGIPADPDPSPRRARARRRTTSA